MRIDEPVLIDTSALLATINSSAPEHAICKAVSDVLPLGKGYICWPVITETTYLLRKQPNLRAEFLKSMAAGESSLLQLGRDDVMPVQAIIDKYHDQEVDLADAAIVHLANRENIRAIFTLDRHHFRMFTRGDGSAFRMLPDDFETDE